MKKSRLFLVLAILFGVAAVVHFVLVLGNVVHYPLCGEVHWILLALAVAFVFDSITKRKQAITRLGLMMNMTCADGNASPEEAEIVVKYAQKLGFSPKRMMKEFNKMSSKGQFEVVLPESDKEKDEILSSLRELMVADGKIDPGEVEFIKKVASTYGVDPAPYINVPKPKKRDEYEEAADALPSKKRKK